MTTQMFVNLPVKHLNRPVAFFTKLGFTLSPPHQNVHLFTVAVRAGQSAHISQTGDTHAKGVSQGKMCAVRRVPILNNCQGETPRVRVGVHVDPTLALV